MKKITFFKIADNYILFGIGLGIFFWIFESFIHIFIFHDAGLVEELFTPNVHEIWMRLIVIFLFFMLGIYAQFMVSRNKRTMRELREYRLHLKGLVKERTAELSAANEKLQEKIIEHKRMAELLRESEAKYSTLVEQAKDGVIVVQDNIFKFVNMAMAKITGYSVEELVEKSYSDIILSEYSNPSSSKKKLDMVDEISPFFYEGKIQCKDGVIKDAEISAAIIKFNGENARMGIIRDITERKKMEEELQEIEKLESIGILAGGIAHDFGNLLTTIIANLSLGKVYAKSDDKVCEVLIEAERASNQAQKLTQQLLTFSKGKEPIKEVASVSKLLRDTVSFTLSGSKTKCDLSLPDDLWCAEIDEGQIIQVINNLIMNADQAMPKGGIIRVSAENLNRTDDSLLLKDALLLKGGKFVKITIKDQGIGISEKFLHHIFEPYFTTKQEGSGLGLSIGYSIVKKHDGYITAESEVGVGTSFHIYLPATVKEVFVVKEVVEEKLCSGKGKILFMDDQKGIRTIIGRVLARLGYEVEFTGNGEEAIELYKKAKTLDRDFDVVILDLTIPGGMGGEEAIQKLLEIDPQVKGIVSSAYSKHPIMSEYKKYGFVGVIAKPYKIEKLSDVLHNVLKEKEKILQNPSNQ